MSFNSIGEQEEKRLHENKTKPNVKETGIRNLKWDAIEASRMFHLSSQLPSAREERSHITSLEFFTSRFVSRGEVSVLIFLLLLIAEQNYLMF